jgi:hypothetical protein
MSQSTGSGSHRLTLVKSQKRNDFRVEALQKCQQQQLPVVLIVSPSISDERPILLSKTMMLMMMSRQGRSIQECHGLGTTTRLDMRSSDIIW